VDVAQIELLGRSKRRAVLVLYLTAVILLVVSGCRFVPRLNDALAGKAEYVRILTETFGRQLATQTQMQFPVIVEQDEQGTCQAVSAPSISEEEIRGTIYLLTYSEQQNLTCITTYIVRVDAGADGEYPATGLVLGTDGNFYGVTSQGGADRCALSDYGCGTIFKITPNGALTTLYSFCSQMGCADGGQPLSLLRARDGDFYGTTYLGGANCVDQFGSPCGTVFKFSLAGGLTTLYSFCKNNGCTDGAGPAGLVQGSDGSLYGTTSSVGADGGGTVFKVTSNGALATLYNFCAKAGCTDGALPAAGLIQSSDGKFYGTTSGGGANVGTGHGGGTIFSITTLGQLTTLYSFCSRQVIGPQLNHGDVRCIDGFSPENVLLQGSDGNFYGTTSSGGGNGCGGVAGCGTVFKITSDGTLTTLLSFDGGANGISPQHAASVKRKANRRTHVRPSWATPPQCEGFLPSNEAWSA